MWVVGQLGRAVKAIDSKSIGVTRVSLTAVDLFESMSHAVTSELTRIVVAVVAAVVAAIVLAHFCSFWRILVHFGSFWLF